MKSNTRTRLIWAIGLLILISACGEKEPVVVESTGEMSVQELKLSNFEEIEVRDMFRVEIFQGDGFKIKIELEESLLPYQQIVTRGKVLRIGLKSGYNYKFQKAIPRVEVTLPDLTRVEINDKSTVIIHDLKSSTEIKFVMDDFSSLSGDIEVDTLRLDINGHSGFHVGGTAEEVIGSVTGQSILDFSNLATKNISVEADQLSEVRQHIPSSLIRPTPSPVAEALESTQTGFPTAIPIDTSDYQGWSKYMHETYGFSLLLPPEWVTDESATGVPILKGHLVNLRPQNSNETLNIRMTFRRVGDEVLLWPTGIGAGEFVSHGFLEVAGGPVRRMLFVCPSGQIDSVWYRGESEPNVRRGEFEFGFIFSHAGVYCELGYGLDGEVQHLAEMIVASLQLD
ncbi:MAG: DUF2807 domain-containing protein [Anaerolineales bacterium]